MQKRKLNQANAPLYDALVAHVQRHPASFHIPGHKSGQGLDPQANKYFQEIMSIDLTEITGLDDLHQPEGVIDDAQQLAAECFGADYSFFLVGGSTVGNLAMILSVCERGNLLIVQRNSHKSVLHGLMLAGIRAVFISPSWHQSEGLFAPVQIDDIVQAIQQYPEAKGVLLTNPDYYGTSVNLRDIAIFLHNTEKVLLIDEAHGAHFSFHSELPPSALACGADIVVQSTHKMLTSLTMGGLLHTQGDRVDVSRIKKTLSMLQSSSPSYPILASIDLTRRQMHNDGKKLIEQSLRSIDHFCERIRTTLPWFGLIQPVTPTNHSFCDPFKRLLTDLTGTLTGHDFRTQLEARECFVELSTCSAVLIIFTLSSTQADIEKLYAAIDSISHQFSLQKKELRASSSNNYPFKQMSTISLPVHMDVKGKRSHSDNQLVTIPIEHIQHAIGRAIAEDIIPYPPGIPICYVGEIITGQLAEQIASLVKQGIHLQGTFTKPISHIHLFA